MRHAVLTLVFFACCVEIYSVLPGRPERRPRVPGEGGYLRGAIHVHSHFSHDGGGTIPEIARAAREAGLDFVVVTDHDTIAAKRSGLEGNYDGVDVFVALEATTPAGHLLAFFPSELAETRSDRQLADIAWEHFGGVPGPPGFFVAIAHPSNLKRPWDRLDRYADGVEIHNLDSAWQRQAEDSELGFLATLLLTPFNEYLAALRFTRFHEKDLTSWDVSNDVSPGHFGILGHDTHAKLVLRRDLAVRWPDYREAFKLGVTLVEAPPTLPGSFEERRRLVWRHLREARVAVAFPFLHPETGHDWFARCGGERHRSGAVLGLGDDCAFEVKLPPGFPYPAVVKLWRDGTLLSETSLTQPGTTLPLTRRGAYRLEVHARVRSLLRLTLRRDVPYLFYNPIYVR